MKIILWVILRLQNFNLQRDIRENWQIGNFLNKSKYHLQHCCRQSLALGKYCLYLRISAYCYIRYPKFGEKWTESKNVWSLWMKLRLFTRFITVHIKISFFEVFFHKNCAPEELDLYSMGQYFTVIIFILYRHMKTYRPAHLHECEFRYY